MRLNITESNARAQELLWVNRFAVDARLIVQMRPGGAAGRANMADRLADTHHLPDFHVDLRQVTVAGGEAVAVVDLYHVAVAAFPAGKAHSAGGGGVDRFTLFDTELDAGVNGRATSERVHAHTEGRAHVNVTDHWLAQRYGDQRLEILVDLRTRDIDPVELVVEGASARLCGLQRYKRTANGGARWRSDWIDAEVAEHGAHAPRFAVGA